MFAFAFIPVAFFASQVVARAFPAPAPFSIPHAISNRAVGISSDEIPDACKSDCKAMLALTDTCTANLTTIDAAENAQACLCTDDASNAYSSCISCAVSLPDAPASFKSSAQSAIDAVTTSCKSAGHPFNNPPKVTGGALSLSPSAALAVLSTVAGMYALMM